MKSQPEFLDFQINDIQLASYSLVRHHGQYIITSGPEYEHLKAYRNLAWEISKSLYRWLSGEGVIFNEPKYLDMGSLSNLGNELEKYTASLLASNQYRLIYNDTLIALERVREEWSDNLERTAQIMNKVTGIEFSSNLTVYITHPAMKQGRYLGDGIIAWTHRSDWPNYNTVYLWHEILHHYQPVNTAADIACSLVADHYLKFQLNNNGMTGSFEGKPEQLAQIEQTYPKLVEYLHTNEKGSLAEIRSWFES